jgi:hypothetical protein
VSPEQLVAILGGFTALLGAVALVLRQLQELRKDLNGRLEQLLVAERERSLKEGELAGRDYIAGQRRRVGDTPISSKVPLTDS